MNIEVLMRWGASSRLLLFILTTVPMLNTYAACWRVNGLGGVSTKQWLNYKPEPDRISGREIELVFDGDNSTTSDSSDMSCFQLSTFKLLCLYSSGGKGTAETWSIDPHAMKVFYTKSMSGYGEYDGASLFIGDLAGRCD